VSRLRCLRPAVRRAFVKRHPGAAVALWVRFYDFCRANRRSRLDDSGLIGLIVAVVVLL